MGASWKRKFAWDEGSFAWGNGLFRLDNTFLRCTDVSKLGAPIKLRSDSLGLLGVCLGTYDLRCLLGDEFFEQCAWRCGFQGLVCLGTSISAPLLLGDLLGVDLLDLLGSVRQGCV